MKTTNENSLQTAVTWAWDAFIISNTIAAVTMKKPAVPAYEDVEEIQSDNALVLADLAQALRDLAEDEGRSAWFLEEKIQAVEDQLLGFKFSDRNIQMLMANTKEVLKAYKAKLQMIQEEEKEQEEAEEQRIKRQWREYRKGNGIPDPRLAKVKEWIAPVLITGASCVVAFVTSDRSAGASTWLTLGMAWLFWLLLRRGA